MFPRGDDAAPALAERIDTNPMPLGDRDVHVWLARPEDITDAALLDQYRGLLDAHERERHRKYRFDRDRHTYLVTHALARATLSRYANVAPDAWSFVTGPHGKPEIDPILGSPLRFNLSHTRGMVACAVTLERDVGVDVETRDRNNRTTEIADRFFSASEVEALMALPEEQRAERFFTYWALKESYIKARGLGLAIPLGAFSFDVDRPGPIRISFDDSLGDDPAVWQFHHAWASESHSLAVGAVRSGAELDIAVRETVPLR